MTSRLESLTIPPISIDFFRKVEAAFPNKPVKDTDNYIKIGRSAGQQEVVNFIRAHIQQTTISGNPDDLIRTPQLSFIQKLLNIGDN